MTEQQFAMDLANEDLPPLDDAPFVWPSGTRSIFTHGDGIELKWDPRPGYEQDRGKYTFVRIGGSDD